MRKTREGHLAHTCYSWWRRRSPFVACVLAGRKQTTNCDGLLYLLVHRFAGALPDRRT
jgi:hypothetical protein